MVKQPDGFLSALDLEKVPGTLLWPAAESRVKSEAGGLGHRDHS